MTHDNSKESLPEHAAHAQRGRATIPVSPLKWHPVEFLEWFTVIAFVIAPLPLVVLHLLQLGHKPHYDFAPMLLLVALGLLYFRWSEAAPVQRQIRGAGILSWMALLGSVGVGAAALLTVSPWLGTASWILGLASILLRTEVAWKGPWSLLWLVLPLPLGFDDWLVQKLQLRASRWSSHILDMFGVVHNLEGNVVRLLDRDMFVDEACSGIMSLVAVLATTGILCVLRRRVALHALPTILLSGFWAVVMNVARISVCVYVWQVWKVDLLTGTSHEVLGFATFAGAILLSLSTEQFVLFFLGPIELPEVSSWIQVALGNPLVHAWNWLAGALPIEEDEAEDPILTIPRVTHLGSMCRAGFGLACMICALIPLPQVLASESFRKVMLVEQITDISADFLPEHIGPWKKLGFKVDRRPKADAFGEHSKVWEYENGEYTAHVSVDYPFHGWHELRACYHGTGWQQTGTELQGSDWAGSLMIHPAGRAGLLLFSVMDSSGKGLEPLPLVAADFEAPKDIASKVWNRVERASKPTRNVITYQVQVLATWPAQQDQQNSSVELPENLRQAVQELFEEVHREVATLLAERVQLEVHQ